MAVLARRARSIRSKSTWSTIYRKLSVHGRV